MTKPRKKTLFALYVLLMGMALLYMLFPSDAVRNYLINRIQRDVPGLQVSIGDLKLAFPPALSIKNVMVSKKGMVLFSADQLTLHPRWITLVSSDKAVSFEALAYQGKLSGVISSAQHSEIRRLSITGTISGLQLDKISALQDNIYIGLSGLVSGQFHFDDVLDQKAIGGGKFFVTDCTMIPSMEIPEMDPLSFKSINIAFAVEGNKLELQQSDFQGTDLSATLSGSIIFESPTDRSVLDLDIHATPQRLFLSTLGSMIPEGLLSSALSGKDEFNFRVTGSLGTPRVAFGAAR